jgi:hypothetical protein
MNVSQTNTTRVISDLQEHYKKVFDALKPCIRELAELLDRLKWNAESRQDVVRLANLLPDPSEVSEEDILCIFEELRRGNLEWAYRLPYCGNLLGVKVSEFLARHNKQGKQPSLEYLQNRSYWPYTCQSKQCPGPSRC